MSGQRGAGTPHSPQPVRRSWWPTVTYTRRQRATQILALAAFTALLATPIILAALL